MQVVQDNFDADMLSTNGKASTHSLAMIILQPESTEEVNHRTVIKHLKKKRNESDMC